MVAAGVGSFVTIKLFVIAEGRYTMPDMPEVSVRESELVFDYNGNTSNYAELRDKALAQNSGKSALVPFARPRPFDTPNLQPPFAFARSYSPASSSGFRTDAAQNLAQLYFFQAAVNHDSLARCPLPTSLAATGLVVPACTGADCPPLEAGQLSSATFACGEFTDLSTALVGMHPDKVWLTRLELNLPSTALDADCFVEPALENVEVLPDLQAGKTKNPPCLPPLFTAEMGSVLIALTSLGTLFARRRARTGRG
jgi:hypothetical protein